MIRTEKASSPVLLELYRGSKNWLNYLLDRVIGLSDMVLMDAYRLPWSATQKIARKIARFAGDIAWLFRAFPRLSAYELVGTDWTVVFVGEAQGLLETCHLFFDENVSQQELGRVALWRLSTQARQWLSEGTDLVICELGRVHPGRPKAPITFTVPTWINQTLTIPTSLEELIAGKDPSSIRGRINKAKKSGFSYRFSQSKADFDYFYYRLYLPFIKGRHGELALLASYEGQWRHWFTRGGLVLVTQDDTPVAGALCYCAEDTCYYVEIGILESNPQLFQQGISPFLVWCCIDWAHGQGAKVINLGGTHAWCSNGSFIFKKRWGAKVVRRRKIYGTWTFLAQNLPSQLQDRINHLGFISEINDQFYGVFLESDGTLEDETDIYEEHLAAQRNGLAGLSLVTPNAKPAIYDSISADSTMIGE